MSAEQSYPVPRAGLDPRFTLGLALDVEAALVKHGFPSIENGLDWVDLQSALFRFVYGDPRPASYRLADDVKPSILDDPHRIGGEAYVAEHGV